MLLTIVSKHACLSLVTLNWHRPWMTRANAGQAVGSTTRKRCANRASAPVLRSDKRDYLQQVAEGDAPVCELVLGKAPKLVSLPDTWRWMEPSGMRFVEVPGCVTVFPRHWPWCPQRGQCTDQLSREDCRSPSWACHDGQTAWYRTTGVPWQSTWRAQFRSPVREWLWSCRHLWSTPTGALSTPVTSTLRLLSHYQLKYRSG